MNVALNRAGKMLSRLPKHGVVRRVLGGLAATTVAVVSGIAMTATPAAAVDVGDYKIVRLHPHVYSEVAVQAFGTGDGTGQGAEVVTSSEWRNAPSQRWKMTYTYWSNSESVWYVTFESEYAYSGGKKCMTATSGGAVLLSTCAALATQQFTLKKIGDDPVGDFFNLKNKYFTDRYMVPYYPGSFPFRIYCLNPEPATPNWFQIITL